MARFIDLGEDDDDQGAVQSLAQQHLLAGLNGLPSHGQGVAEGSASKPIHPATSSSPPHPTRIQNAVTRAFSCYPVVFAIVSNIDLNTLDSLARASYYIHGALIQYRQVLLSSTLHCSNEDVPVDRDETLRYRARAGNWYYMEDGRNYNGKSGDCARDLVDQCRRCSEVICRNCAIKPPAPVTLRERHRRLCIPCSQAPIATIAKPSLDPSLPLDAEDVQREVCKCADQGVWLCQPCGRSIRGADNEYQAIWRWRSHYGEVLGGLGTGIGEGDRGVICGREGDCCAAKEREHEIDCDAEDAKDNNLSSWADLQSASSSNTPSPSGSSHHSQNPLDLVLEDFRQDRTPSPQLRTGYERHEIEGIGGVVKRKLVRMVRVGACVPEFEDEKGPGKRPLGREVRGETRSWCGWCWRVIPGEKDLAGTKAK